MHTKIIENCHIELRSLTTGISIEYNGVLTYLRHYRVSLNFIICTNNIIKQSWLRYLVFISHLLYARAQRAFVYLSNSLHLFAGIV